MNRHHITKDCKDSGFKSISLNRIIDNRGVLFEAIKFSTFDIPSNGQVYIYSVNKGYRRGDHYHKYKREWICCIYGTAILELSLNNKVTQIIVRASEPVLFEIYPYTIHTLINNCDDPAIIMSYASEEFDQAKPDTYNLTPMTSDE